MSTTDERAAPAGLHKERMDLCGVYARMFETQAAANRTGPPAPTIPAPAADRAVAVLRPRAADGGPDLCAR
ncbi:hypothetical protein GCM10018781_56090 [Kitasatospora indigofera]|uniref:Uncharacterized protein n=1 Tax=Kitasatospora indigofera TaxID=67307 RepID=A0A919G6K0_9ACTN|nr:hypothetical protein [Kitasatospora indigofera]GHH79022.1 hypothetical protein GCM10018781_56090 [Kitasatospora indigofera]